VSLTDGAGGSRHSIFYDAWGNERERIGASVNNFTFTGHEKDDETGLIYAKARFYDAEVGRFLSQDGLLGTVGAPPSLHRYVYTVSNPTRFIDPRGREPITIGTLALLGLLGAEIGFFTDYTAQAVETSGFLREDFNAKRSALVTAGGGVSGVFGGVLAFFGFGTAAATTSAIALDSSLDTGVEAMLVEEGEDFDAGLTFAKNVGLNTAFAGLGAAGGKLFDAARSFFRGGDEITEDLAKGSGNVLEETHKPGAVDETADDVSDGIVRSNEADDAGPGTPRSPLGDEVGESFPDPDSTTYRNGLRPDTPVIDHVEARALGGDPVDPRNLHKKAWSENARKGWHEGEYLKLKKEYMSKGMSEQHAEWALEDYKRWIMTDVHATPVDPAELDKLRSP
jgi:RHS repeat-associated protein